MYEFPIHEVVETFEVGNVHAAHRFDGREKRALSLTRGFPLALFVADTLLCGSQHAQDARAVEPLTFTMIAEAHSTFSDCIIAPGVRRFARFGTRPRQADGY